MFQCATQPTRGLNDAYFDHMEESGNITTGDGPDTAPKRPSQTNDEISIASVRQEIRELTHFIATWQTPRGGGVTKWGATKRA